MLAVMVCAGGVEDEDSRQGDSGGPLSYDKSGQHELVINIAKPKGCLKIVLSWLIGLDPVNIGKE